MMIEKNIIRDIQLIQLEMMKELHILCEKNNLQYFLCEGSLLGAIRHHGFIPWDDDLDIVMPRDDYIKLINILKKNCISGCYLDCYETNSNFWLPFAKIRKKNTVYKEEAAKFLNDSKCGIWIDIFPLDYSKKGVSMKNKIKKIIVESIKYRLQINNLKMPLNCFSRRWIPLIIIWGIFSDKRLKVIQNYVMQYKSVNKNFYINYASTYGIEKVSNPINYYKSILVDFEDTKLYIPSNFDIMLKKVYGNYMEIPPIEKRNNHSAIKIKY